MLNLILAALLLTPAPSAAPPTPSPGPVATIAATLPSDPLQLARQQFAAFAAGAVDQSWYAQPMPQSALDQVKAGLTAAGRIKSVTLLKQAQTPYGKGYAYKFVCENASVIEQFSVLNGKITGIFFSPAK